MNANEVNILIASIMAKNMREVMGAGSLSCSPACFDKLPLNTFLALVDALPHDPVKRDSTAWTWVRIDGINIRVETERLPEEPVKEEGKDETLDKLKQLAVAQQQTT